MAEIINPNFLRSELKARTSNLWPKYGYPILIIFLIVLLIFVGYILYKEYYNEKYELKNLLIDDYQIALEYDLQKTNLSKIQLNDLTDNQIINKIFIENKLNIDSYLNTLPLGLLNDIKKQKHGLIFMPDNNQFAYLVEFNNEVKDLDYPKETEELFLKLIMNKVLIITNDKELLSKINNQELSKKDILNFSVNLKPWSTIYFQKAFFNQEYTNPLLTDLQLILNPLLTTNNENFNLEISVENNKLILNLEPSNLNNENNITELENIINYSNLNNKFSLGINNIELFINQLENNTYLQDIFRSLDNNLWIEHQFSLSNIIKDLKGPIILSFNDNSWQITTNINNQELFNDNLKNYLARFTETLRQELILPDNTKAIELITNPASVIWQETTINEWQMYKYDMGSKKMGYASNNDILIISNNLDQIDFYNIKNNNKDTDCSLNNLNSFIIIKPESAWPISSSKLKEFTEISAFSSNNNQIRMCLKLK
ncbi:hypothetical protein HOE31_03890 [bacterium]|jgi:hypothetical protein|nr:hypothetical protein [bacterium]MBT4122060.1 hypothetical protein [bacterium]MBT4334906.1 hypothetical protein [bacterium]MBT4495833.1 hypothetical protein [bacterium]MBT4763710.1 hypothetical protein [bacterium]